MLIILGFLVGAFALSPLWKNKNQRNIYLIIVWVALVFITSFRSYSFYTDTKGYYKFFQMNAEKPLSQLFENVLNGEGKDPVYHLCGALVASIGIDFRGWLVIVSVIYYTGFILVVKRFSNLPFVSVLALTSLSYVFFTMTGIRQTLAMGFTFFAFIKAYDKKFIPFLLFTLLGSCFHSSALIFILAYFLMHRKIGVLQIVFLAVAMAVCLLFPSAINAVVRELAWNENLEQYADVATGLTWFGYAVQLLIGVGSILIAPKYCLKEKEGIALINMLVLGLVFQTFVIRIDGIFRLSMYFNVYSTILLANVIKKQQDEKSKQIAYAIVAIVLLAYMFNASQFKYFTMFGGA